MSQYASVHQWANIAGAGDARPTALQIIKDYHKPAPALAGQVILITGVSSGIGAAAASALAATGATVFCAGRSIPKARQALGPAVADLPNVRFLELDLCSQASVRAFAAEFLAQSGGRLNVLVNNAGGISASHRKTVDGFEYQLALNFLGPFLLFALLRDALLASASPEAPSRVVNVSSFGHRAGGVRLDDLGLDAEGAYSSALGYAQAKTASIYLASEIERRYGAARGLHAWSVHPGAVVDTAFLDNSGMDPATVAAVKKMWPEKLFKSPEQGAATQVWAAVSDDVLADGVRGKYLEDCAVSKPWQEADFPQGRGYEKHAYDEEAARRLWEISEGLVGVKA